MINFKDEYVNILEIEDIITNVLQLSSFDEVKKLVNNTKVNLTEDEIKKYLQTRMMIEKPELQRRKYTTSNKNKTSSELFVQEFESSKYELNSYTYKYFNKYIDILKIKLNKLFNVMDTIKNYSKLSNKEKSILKDLDIKLYKGLLTKEDANRILMPILYNLSDLKKKSDEANNYTTYLSFSISLDEIYIWGLNENDVYPSTNIQSYEMFEDMDSRNIPLTENQKKLIIKNHLDSFGKTIGMLKNIV